MGRMTASVLALSLVACGGSTATSKDAGITDATSDEAAPDVIGGDSESDASSDSPVDAPGMTDTSQDAVGDGPPNDGGATILFSGLVVSSGTTSFPLSAAQVCVAQTTNCSTTNSQGAFALRIPANARVAITIQRSSYTNVLVPIITSTVDQTSWEIGTLNAAATTSNYQAGGATYPDPSTAFLASYATTSNSQSGHSGVTFQYAPSPNHGPIYTDATGAAAPDAGSTSTWGEGIATFPSTVSQVIVTFEPQTLSCTPNFGGWPATGTNSVLVPLLAGFETHVGQGCSP